MTKYFEKIIDAQTGEETLREYTKAEVAIVEAAIVEAEKHKAEAQAKATARQAILDRLGLTADEAALILG
jgi:hypothetical protein